MGCVVTETVAPLVETATPIVTHTVPAVIEPVVQTVASVPVVGDVVQPVADAATEFVPTATTPVTDLLQSSPVSSLTDPVLAQANATGAPDAPVRSAHEPPGSPAPSSSAGHGGGSVSDSARLRDAAADPLRAWKRSLTVTDDDLPSSPVADTDASPD